MQLDDAPRDGETEARVAVFGLSIRRLVVAIENARKISFRDPFAGVRDTENHLVGIAANGDAHSPAGRRVPEGVVDEIVEHALHQRDVGGNQGQIRVQLHGQLDLALAGFELEFLYHVLNKLGE